MKSENNAGRSNLIIIFGLPGSGKSTQAALLEERMGYKYVSWGRITRDIIDRKLGSENNRKIILDNLGKDSLYPDGYIKKHMIRVITGELEKGVTNFVIDGFPKRAQEAQDCIEIVKELGLNLKCLIKIDCTEKNIFKRVESRKYCENCGKFYNDILKPKNEGICDFDSGRLIKRIDDNSEMVKLRIDEYSREVTPAIELLSNISEKVFSVNGDQDKLLIFSDITKKLKLDEFRLDTEMRRLA